MITLEELRTQRADAESEFQAAMAEISEALPDQLNGGIVAAALGYHREVSALYSAEVSLISNSTLNIKH